MPISKELLALISVFVIKLILLSTEQTQLVMEPVYTKQVVRYEEKVPYLKMEMHICRCNTGLTKNRYNQETYAVKMHLCTRLW